MRKRGFRGATIAASKVRVRESIGIRVRFSVTVNDSVRFIFLMVDVER